MVEHGYILCTTIKMLHKDVNLKTQQRKWSTKYKSNLKESKKKFMEQEIKEIK